MDSTQRDVEDVPTTLRRAVWRNVRCARCDWLLRPAQLVDLTQDGGWLQLAGDRALTLQVRPAYGTYLDSVYDLEQFGADLFILCSACADRLRIEIPGLGRLLDGLQS